jgi:hypothetical protein
LRRLSQPFDFQFFGQQYGIAPTGVKVGWFGVVDFLGERVSSHLSG